METIESLKAENDRLKSELTAQQSPAVAVPIGYATSSSMAVFNMGSADGVVIHKVRTDERCIPVFTAPHQRVTEQDAAAIYESAVEHYKYTQSFNRLAWLHMSGRALLAKLNGVGE